MNEFRDQHLFVQRGLWLLSSSFWKNWGVLQNSGTPNDYRVDITHEKQYSSDQMKNPPYHFFG